MKRKLLYKFLLVIASFGVMTGCDEGSDGNFGDKSIQASNPTISVSGLTSATVNEEDQVTFSVTLSAAQLIDVDVFVNVTGGTAKASDYSINSEKLTIKAGQFSATGVITFELDDAIDETDESLTIVVGDEKTVNAKITPVSATYTIKDKTIPSDLKLSLTWDNTFVIGGVDYHLVDDAHIADATDFDLYVYNENGDEVSAYPSLNTSYLGATASEPEGITLSKDLPDGTYYVTWNAWEIDFVGDFNGAHYQVEIPLKVNAERKTPSGSVEYKELGITTDSNIFAIDNGVAGTYTESVILTVIKTGNNFEILDPSDDSLGTLKMKPFRTEAHSEVASRK